MRNIFQFPGEMKPRFFDTIHLKKEKIHPGMGNGNTTEALVGQIQVTNLSEAKPILSETLHSANCYCVGKVNFSYIET